MTPVEVKPLGLFLVFLRLGATAYGGPAMAAHLRAELVDKRRWVTPEDFREGLALCQMIPGATMVQVSTYIGYRAGGARGALLAAVGFILPAFLAMTALSAAYVNSATLPIVRALFRGLGAVVVAIVLNACLKLGRTSLQGWPAVLIAALALVAMLRHVSFVVVVVAAAALAVPLYRCRPCRRPRETAGS